MGITAVILPHMKTAVSVPDPLFDAADRFAHRLGLSRSELYSKALQEYLCAHREEGVTEALDRIYEEEDSSLDPVLASIQGASLPKGEW
jgi:metal-responsive CopG/Arc/MetJ family transcriptional regulator